MGSRSFFITLLFLIFILFACRKEALPDHPSGELSFLALGHPRTDDNSKVDPDIERLDFAEYDLLLLGGDIAEDASNDMAVLELMDDVFGIRKETTLWALGNHDYSNPDLIEQITGRPAFFHYSFQNIAFVVLDTQDSLSSITQPQIELLKSVIDTLDKSTHLILLTHKLLWMYGHPELESQINDTANGGLGDCSFCTNPNNFYERVYPLLLEANKKGVEVICLAGDIGRFVKSFEFLTEEGIRFLATGIQSGDEGNKTLLFKYDTGSGILDWTFESLKDLP